MPPLPQTLQSAVQHHQAGNLQQAEQLYRQILAVDPRHVDALHLLGLVALQVGRHDFAVQYISEALQLRPTFAEAHNSLGVALLEQGKPADAAQCHRRALELKPGFVEAHVNMGNASKDLGKLDDAVASYRQALALRPGYAEALVNMGHALKELGQPEEAVVQLREALRLNPNIPEAHNNLANALKEQMKLEEAIASYREAIRLRPSFADAHRNLGMLLLLMGRFAEGWAEYEWRWQCREFTMPALRQPLWDGSPLAGRTILLHAEQGFGDAIQFARFATEVKRRGAAAVYLGCSPPLLRLLARCPGVDQVFPGDPLPPFHVHIPLLSLPRLLGANSLESVAAKAYLDVDPGLVEHWRRLLGLRMADANAGPRNPQSAIRNPQLNVGIVWQGRPDHRGDRWRSVALRHFARLKDVPGVRLVSLQKELGREQLAQTPELALDLGPELTDLADTAAVLKNLDLLVTVDTSVAHLAGALGVPAWVALPYIPDWRWLLDREDSPWYPSLRLFRQRRLGDWDEVFARIAVSLQDHRSLAS